jgi:tetratricopeptide (TPR) repeat protein
MTGTLVLLLTVSISDAVPPTDADSVDGFTESVAPLTPRIDRTEEDRAEVAAAALYAHGRLLLRRGDHAAALRRYQRAWRYDPQAVSLLPQIVFLAHRLGRSDEAARYAFLAAERTELSSALLRQLALQLSRRQDWEGAIRLFEKSLNRAADDADDGAEEAGDLGATVAHLEMGRLYFLTGQFERSARHFASVQELLEDPQRLAANPTLEKALLGQADRTYRMLAESFYQAARYDQAEAMLLKARDCRTEGDPQEDASDYYLARTAAKQDRVDDAVRYLDAYFESGSSAAGVQPLELLRELIDGPDVDGQTVSPRFMTRLNALLKSDPNNPALLQYAAQCDLAEGRLDQAERHLERLLVVQSGLEAYPELIQIYLEQRAVDDLLDVLAVAAARGASLRDVLELLSPITEDEAMVSELINRIGVAPDEQDERVAAGAQLAAALLAEQRGDGDTADRLFQSAISQFEAATRNQWLVDWGLQLLLDGRYEPAATQFRAALAEPSLEDRHAACHFYLIRALALADQTEQALDAARRGAELHPDSPRLQAQPGWVLYHARRYREAETAYRRLLQQFESLHNPEIRDTLRQARLALSNICVQLNRTPEAEEWLEQILDEFPEDVGALNDLGYLWTEQGKNPNRALAMVQQAVRADPDNAAYRDSLGWAYYQLGRYEEAIDELQQAASGEDPDGVILEHLGDANAKAGRKDEALSAWRRALDALTASGDKAKRKTIQQKIKDSGK